MEDQCHVFNFFGGQVFRAFYFKEEVPVILRAFIFPLVLPPVVKGSPLHLDGFHLFGFAKNAGVDTTVIFRASSHPSGGGG